MIARATGDDVHGLGLAENFGRRRTERSFEQPSIGDTLLKGIGDSPGLFVYFLEHEVRVLALVCSVGGQFALMDLALYRLAAAVGDSDRCTRHFGDVAFLEEDEGARLRKQCRDIGSDEILVLAETDDDGTSFTREDDALGV